jgi:3-oxoadipate enol-lactonase
MAKVEIKNKEIYYEIHGEGEPLVFLNGIMMSAASWRPFVNSFKGYKLILIDLLDQGMSDKAAGEYTQELHVEMLKEFFDKLSLSNINLLGISYGGEVAQLFTLNYPEYINSLILSNTTSKTTRVLKDIEVLWDKVAATYDGSLFFKATMPYVYSHKFYEENVHWMEKREKLFIDLFKPEWYEGFRRAIKSAGSLDITEKIKEIIAPTLIISGDLDIITPLEYQLKIKEAIKDSRMFIIKDAGHGAMYEKPYEFAAAVKGFLDVIKNNIIIP